MPQVQPSDLDLCRSACGERITTPTVLTCGNAELVIEENVQLGYPDSVD